MYAKDFFTNDQLQIDPGLCFVIMPFASKFDEVWEAIKDTVSFQPFNLQCRRADDISQPGHIMTDVLENIGRARVLIADLSGQNPNVFYELGIAHSFKDQSQVILIASSADAIPFDLRHLRSIIYGDQLENLKTQLARTLQELDIKQFGLTLAEGETGKFSDRLTGDDRFLYEVKIRVEYLGVDGVKFMLKLIKLGAGKEPEIALTEACYLGTDEPAIKLPSLSWSLCYSRPDEAHAHFIIGRPMGWVR